VFMHVARGEEKSKTVAVFVPANNSKTAKDDATANINMVDKKGPCHVHCEKGIKYLGVCG
jgi:hypothetical protein